MAGLAEAAVGTDPITSLRSTASLALRGGLEYSFAMGTDVRSLSGILPPIPTPFGANGEIDPKALTENLRWWSRHDLTGIVVLGSNGEAVSLEADEKQRLIEAVRCRLPDDWVLVAGTGEASTRATIARTQAAADAGARCALVLPPSYYRGLMTDAALDRHFRAVADASPIPILLYNMPACTGIDLGAELVIALGSHENILGIKDSGGDLAKLARIHGELRGRFRVLAGSAGFLLPALSVGAVGGILALANLAPIECLEILRLACIGDTAAARALQARLIAPNAAVTRRWGVAGLKAAMEMIGLRGGPVRAPLMDLTGADRAELRRILEASGILASPEKEMT